VPANIEKGTQIRWIKWVMNVAHNDRRVIGTWLRYDATQPFSLPDNSCFRR